MPLLPPAPKPAKTTPQLQVSPELWLDTDRTSRLPVLDGPMLAEYRRYFRVGWLMAEKTPGFIHVDEGPFDFLCDQAFSAGVTAFYTWFATCAPPDPNDADTDYALAVAGCTR